MILWGRGVCMIDTGKFTATLYGSEISNLHCVEDLELC